MFGVFLLLLGWVFPCISNGFRIGIGRIGFAGLVQGLVCYGFGSFFIRTSALSFQGVLFGLVYVVLL